MLRSADPVLAALNDHVVRALVVTGLEALGVLTPWRHGVRIALARLALTTTVWVIDRVHRETAYRRANTEPSLRAGLAVAAEVVLVVTNFAKRCAAVDMHLARLTRLQTQIGVNPFACGERHRASCATCHLAALAGLHLDVVHDRADRNVAQLHRIARLDRRVRTGADLVTGLHTFRCEDVATLAVRILDQSDVARAVRIVLDALNHARDAVLVTLEVDDAVLLTRAATNVACRNAAGVIASTRLVLGFRQRQVRAALVQVRAVDLD